ncbi:MAG: RHS repeat-associated core domain-containing protein [Ectothiorhodospiraceae bacterium]|nr:RHS repeat-associated core domain-containing protein [Ectothiorhodospiraceae bacterium]
MAQGTVVRAIDYDAYGNIIRDSNPDFTIPFGFAGGLHDPDTGLIRFGYRDYDPDTGRWTARDPIGFAGGDTNLYGYVLRNPVTLVDMTGLAPSWVGPTAAVTGAAGGGLLLIGVKTGNPIAGGVGLGFVAISGAFTLWDWATTPSETIDAIRESDDMKYIEENLRGIQDLMDSRHHYEGDFYCLGI